MENGVSELLGQVCFCMENGFGVFFYRNIRDRYLSFLARESECIPLGGMEDMCRLVIGCAQPNGWKTASTDPNWDLFTECRWLLLEWGCLPMLRSM